ncbi:Ig-like domain-containing protein [Oscillospiraceae bacterium MB08-C2-2]|nr:Ig-like domain-containing protein [Oscillospiraceae bacterium MB08-C2-2]
MKRLKIALLCVLSAYSMSVGVLALSPFSMRTALSSPRLVNGVISVTQGEVLSFSARDLELRTSLQPGELEGLTITSLPDPRQGRLMLGETPVLQYQRLTRSEIQRLTFEPEKQLVNSSFSFIPQGGEAVTASLSIKGLASGNLPPVVEGMSISTVENIAVQSYLNVYDSEGDAVSIQVTQRPTRGEVTFDGKAFRYRPYQNMIGPDSFTVCAVDSAYNFSKEATINVEIEKSPLGFVFTDMKNSPSAYAAIKLHQSGVATGQRVGNQWFFYPEHQMTKGEFLVMLLAAIGQDKSLPPTVNTGLPSDSIIPSWLKPYVKQGLALGILAKNEDFLPDQIPTRAEAVILTDRAAGITDVKQYNLQISDLSDIPSWAMQSYMDLAAYKMLDLYDGSAHPSQPLTNSYCADLIWQLYKHSHRSA